MWRRFRGRESSFTSELQRHNRHYRIVRLPPSTRPPNNEDRTIPAVNCDVEWLTISMRQKSCGRPLQTQWLLAQDRWNALYHSGSCERVVSSSRSAVWSIGNTDALALVHTSSKRPEHRPHIHLSSYLSLLVGTVRCGWRRGIGLHFFHKLDWLSLRVSDKPRCRFVHARAIGPASVRDANGSICFSLVAGRLHEFLCQMVKLLGFSCGRMV
jgi:hypothetical protein